MTGRGEAGVVAAGLADQLRHPQGLAGRLAGGVMRQVNRRPYALAIQALGVRDGHDVLELGFGPGEGLRTLARLSPAGRIHGVDQSSAMLAQASALNRAAIRSGQVRLSQAQFAATGLPDRSVDRILAVNVAYFWSDGPAVLAELDRVLRPGGRISLYVTAAATMSRWRFPASGLHRVFDGPQLAAFLADGPFDARRIGVEAAALPMGVSGLVATIDKAEA